MKISVMQPYFFPYLGYFSLIQDSDVFVVLDNVQYVRRGWMNRNRVIGKNQSPVYFHLSTIKAPQKTMTRQIKIDHNREWKKTLLDKLDYYEKSAPYFEETKAMVERLISFETDSLCDMNIHILEELCKFLGITTKFVLASDLEIDESKIIETDDWGLEITKTFGASDYINLWGGRHIYSVNKYNNSNITLKFIENELVYYNQHNEMFIKSLSIIDVLMYNDRAETMDLINKYSVS